MKVNKTKNFQTFSFRFAYELTMDSVDVDLERKTTDDPEELLSRLESLPAYDSLTQLSDEPPAIFDDEQEPSSGLIELLRKNSQVEEPTPVVNKFKIYQ